MCMGIQPSPLVSSQVDNQGQMGETVRDGTFPFLAHQLHGDAGLAIAHGREGGQRGHHPENGGRAVLSSRQQARIVLEAHTEPRAPAPRQLAPGHQQRRWKRPHYSHLWEGCLRKRDAQSCGIWEVYEWTTCWRGRLGALADGGEARVATDLIHGVKNNAPLCCEIGHCDHNDVLFMVVAFRGAEKSVRPLSERTAASTIHV